MYADDLAILANSPVDLQLALFRLKNYCRENSLTINESKTKILPFYKGTPPFISVFLNNKILEVVNEFNYLGVTLTTRLSFIKHINRIATKCNARLGYLFAKLHINQIPLPVALSIFNTFILPIITYAIPAWFVKLPKSSSTKINSLFTKFLKRFLGIPYSANNNVVHFVTDSKPLSDTLFDNWASVKNRGDRLSLVVNSISREYFLSDWPNCSLILYIRHWDIIISWRNSFG